MLPRRSRLGRRGIEALYRSRTDRVHSAHLTLIFSPAPQHRWSVVISKKVARRAVARNHLKRQLAALLREGVLPALSPCHGLLVAKKGAAELSFSELREEVATLIKAASRRRAPPGDEMR
ncbi:ribonuclease P protein component [Patescibacteria group bacterium]|jgi:ribonuclease P protein component|nr:ribonuclease P protein component [Patescibacteria group bacterium]